MEYLTSLKSEQAARIVMRDTSLYVFVATIFGVYAAEGQAGANSGLLDLVRTCSIALSAIMLSIYLSNDYYVSKIGHFVASDPQAKEFHRWEAFHRVGWRHHAQKFFRSLFVIVLFGGWTGYQGLSALQSDNLFARSVTIVFCLIVTLQLILFLTFALEKAPATASTSAEKHVDKETDISQAQQSAKAGKK